MTKQRFLKFCGLFLSLCIYVSFAEAQNPNKDKDLKDLKNFMTGSFDTFAQVERDEENDTKYRHIRALLHVIPIEIPEMNSGFTFYVENAAAEARNKPYRQRVYYLKRNDAGEIILQVFKISETEKLINAHKNKSVLANIKYDELTLEAGCDIVYKRIGKNLFKGSNGGSKDCKSSLRGATHTNSESEITPTTWTNLDQGFDDKGNHKWGPPPGVIGHIFVRRNRL